MHRSCFFHKNRWWEFFNKTSLSVRMFAWKAFQRN